MFAYCNNNPINYVDSNGTEPISIILVGGTALVVGFVISLFSVSPEGQALSKSIIESIYETLEQIQEAVANAPERIEEFIDAAKGALSQAKEYARSISNNFERYVVHHIVAKAHPYAAPARMVLESVGIDPVSNGLNLAIIPEHMHKSMHTKSYYFYVNSCFDGLYGNEEAVIQTLARLQLEIQLYCHTGINRW